MNQVTWFLLGWLGVVAGNGAWCALAWRYRNRPDVYSQRWHP